MYMYCVISLQIAECRVRIWEQETVRAGYTRDETEVMGCSTRDIGKDIGVS